MVVHFKNIPEKTEELKALVERFITEMAGKDGFSEGDMHYTAETISECFYVQPDGDLYVGDEFSEEISGALLQGLMGQYKVIGDMEIIVPRKYN